MVLAIFDLDETLISADSDYLWGEFLVDERVVDEKTHRRKNREFYEQYKRGKLDVDAYLRFACSVLTRIPRERLLALRRKFVEERIRPAVLPRAVDAVESHRKLGDRLLVITSTIEFITRPIVDLFGIEDLIAPVPEQRRGQYTGEITGTPSFGPGKVARLKQWLEDKPFEIAESYFYSDSINDVPLLEAVGSPVAVDPDNLLEAQARQRGWKIVSFRGD